MNFCFKFFPGLNKIQGGFFEHLSRTYGVQQSKIEIIINGHR
jgi:hypothetical protein